MVLFTIMIVCGLFVWKRLYAGFIYCLFLIYWRERFRGESCNPFNLFHNNTFCAYPWISNDISRGPFLCSMIWEDFRYYFILVELFIITVFFFLFIIFVKPNCLVPGRWIYYFRQKDRWNRLYMSITLLKEILYWPRNYFW